MNFTVPTRNGSDSLILGLSQQGTIDTIMVKLNITDWESNQEPGQACLWESMATKCATL